MIEIVQKTLEFYFEKLRKPELSELDLTQNEATSKKGCAFVTLYIKGEIHGSAGNIKEIHPTLSEEIIASTIDAIKDSRFPALSKDDLQNIQYRVDYIEQRTPLTKISDITRIDPSKQGVIAILKNYDSLAVILPNISAKLITGEDFIPVLENKLSTSKIDENNTIFYKIETKMQTNY